MVRAEVLLQLARLSPDNAQSLRQAQELLRNLPNSHAKVYALLDLAKQLNHDSLTILMEAVESAEKLNNQRIASFAYGEVGYYYELKRRYAEAKSWTHKARAAAETAIAPDSAYRWHWQMDRILIQTEAPIAAIESYRSAIASLQAIRGDLIQFSRSRTFNFQEKIEPVYRELLQLLLSQNTEDNIDEVLKIRDLLQLSELENFFQIDEPTATLGMSGVVVRAGVNSVLGSLWSIKDRSIVSLISEFYHHWTKLDSSKPESLPGSPHLIWYKMYLTKVILYDLFLKSNIVSLI